MIKPTRYTLAGICGLFFMLNTHAYQKTTFSVGVKNPKLDKFQLVNPSSGKKSQCLWFGSPELTNQWQKLSFTFIPEGNGLLYFRFGPSKEGDIPFYFTDVKVNGKEINLESDWSFLPPKKGDSKQGMTVVDKNILPSGKPFLQLYHYYGAAHEALCKKGEKMEITMMAKSGSVIDTYINLLTIVKQGLSECEKISTSIAPTKAKDCELVKENLIRQIDSLSVESKKWLNVSAPPQIKEVASVKEIENSLALLIASYKTRLKQDNGKSPILHDNPLAHEKLKHEIRQLIKTTNELKTNYLLALML